MVYCVRCGTGLPEGAKFCRSCGTAREAPPSAADSAPPEASGPIATRQDQLPSRSPEPRATLAEDRTANAAPADEAPVVVTEVDSAPVQPKVARRRGLGIAAVSAAVGILAALGSQLIHPADWLASLQGSSVGAPSTRLDLRAGDCGVNLGSNPVTFAPTQIGADVHLEPTALCRIARDLAVREERNERKTVDDICNSIQLSSNYPAGPAGFAQFAARLLEAGQATDPVGHVAYNGAVMCADPAAVVNTLTSRLQKRIYSVGTLQLDGTSCLGYLEETSGSTADKGSSVAYDLKGLGWCANRSLLVPKLFDAAGNPTARKVGDALRSDFAYTGALPLQWTWRGTTYAFTSDARPAVDRPHPTADPPTSAGAIAPSAANVRAGPLAAPEAQVAQGAPTGTLAAPAPPEPVAGLATLSLAQLQSLVEQGSASACAELGTRYLKGVGVAENVATAVYWFQQATDRGEPRGETNLGWLYATGKGVARNDEAAVALFLKAAAQGYPNAEDSLGWMYEKGRGVAQDRGVAISWYRKAAARGFEKSRQNLARLADDHG